jgi:hypothetical protein
MMLAENPLSEQTTVNDAPASSLVWFAASGNRHTVRAHIGTYALPAALGGAAHIAGYALPDLASVT